MDNAAQVEIQGLIFNSNIVSKQKVIEENVVFGKKDAYGESRAMRRADKVGGINDLNNNFISIQTVNMSKMTKNWQSEDYDDESANESRGRKYSNKLRINKITVQRQKSSAYRKKKCQFYNKGVCHRGSQCPFTHSFIPDIAKKTCKFILTNSCTKGHHCPYSHNTKRYPCKFFHIEQNCPSDHECKFSHQQIDPDFEEQFLKDNQEFLVQTYKQNPNLPWVTRTQLQKYLNYIQKNDLLNKENIKESEPAKSTFNLPFIFGMNFFKSAQDDNQQQFTSSSKKQQTSLKQSNVQLPFSIKLSHSHRTLIPEQLQQVKKLKVREEDSLRIERSDPKANKYLKNFIGN